MNAALMSLVDFAPERSRGQSPEHYKRQLSTLEIRVHTHRLACTHTLSLEVGANSDLHLGYSEDKVLPVKQINYMCALIPLMDGAHAECSL